MQQQQQQQQLLLLLLLLSMSAQTNAEDAACRYSKGCKSRLVFLLAIFISTMV
jgi:hypothetical protein